MSRRDNESIHGEFLMNPVLSGMKFAARRARERGDSMSDWRPIETAPIDEDVIVCDDVGGIWVAYHTKMPYWWTSSHCADDPAGFPGCEAVAWMPLPEPPKDKP